VPALKPSKLPNKADLEKFKFPTPVKLKSEDGQERRNKEKGISLLWNGVLTLYRNAKMTAGVSQSSKSTCFLFKVDFQEPRF
jgi:hypothetical protein